MKKQFLIINLLTFYGYLTNAQDNIKTSRDIGQKSIHVAFSPSTSAPIGIHGGLLANSNGVLSGSGLLDAGGVYLSARYNNKDFVNMDRLSVDLGISLQLIEFAHIFMGAGYSKYLYSYKEPVILPGTEIKGYEIEGGTIINIRKLTLHIGISILKFEHLDVFGGIGYTF